MVFQDLSRHAEDVFGELTNEAHQFNDRCRILGERIVNLNDRISLMAQNSSEHMEPYALRSREIKYDDQVVSRDTLPKALQATYYEADPPPPLQMLQKYRDDNKDPLKIYTNPDYFFELWRENLQKEMEKARQERKDKKRRAKEKEKLTKLNRENQRKPVNEIAPVKRHQDQWKAKGAEFEADAKQKYAQQLQNTNKMREMNISQHQQHHKPSRPKSKYPPDEYPPPTDSGNSTMNSTISVKLNPANKYLFFFSTRFRRHHFHRTSMRFHLLFNRLISLLHFKICRNKHCHQVHHRAVLRVPDLHHLLHLCLKVAYCLHQQAVHHRAHHHLLVRCQII